ncbi:MAG: hypothetical protein ACKVQU_22000 [Burkholderiales bacterium]
MSISQSFEIAASRAHGHVQAVALAMHQLGFAALIAAKPCPERQRVLAMVAARIVAPHTKLAEDFGVAACDEDDLYGWVRSTTVPPIGCARLSCCVCSPTTWSGTCARLGAR